MELFLIVLGILLCIVILVFTYKYVVLQDKLVVSGWYKEQYRKNWENEVAQLSETASKLKQAVSRSKSVEVRTGHIVEKVAPFLDAFGHNPRHAQFLGNPIDYVVFADDEVVFIEVKSGKSRLTPKQNKIKKLVEDKKVAFKVVRVDYE